MRSTRLLPAIGSALFLLPAASMAATLTFTGEIVGSTCTVGGAAAAMTVPLGRIDASQLATEGDIAGRRAFSIKLTCTAAPSSKVAVSFDSASADPVTGNLRVEAGKNAATNVQIALHNQSNEQQKFNAAPTANSWRAVVAGEVTLHYTASYIATGGAATAGPAGAVATVSVVYQ